MTSRGVPNPGDIARLLRQRRELGATSWTFQGLDRSEVLGLARRRPESEPAPSASTPFERPVERSGDPGPREAEPMDSSFEPPMVYEALREAALGCTRCGLADGRTQVVFSDGSSDARLMVVGEAPGANEDRTGLPFVGPAGKLLDLLLASVGLSRKESVYICNVLKCRPPGNRNPRPAEIQSCAPWLLRQIDLVKPEAILAVGTFSGQLLSGKDMALGELRGQIYSYHGTPLVVTYHPAALLRNSGWVRPTWDDLQLLRRILDGS
jgi:uracil-DNA glycosylase